MKQGLNSLSKGPIIVSGRNQIWKGIEFKVKPIEVLSRKLFSNRECQIRGEKSDQKVTGGT